MIDDLSLSLSLSLYPVIINKSLSHTDDLFAFWLRM